MRIFIYVVIVVLAMTGLLFYCHRTDIAAMRDDYQAYSNKSLLPDDIKDSDIR